MKKKTLKLILSVSFLVIFFQPECAAQEFIHDTLNVSSSHSNHLFYYGLSSPADVLAVYDSCSIKTKVTKKGKKANRLYTVTQILTLSDGCTNFYFLNTGTDKQALNSTLKLTSASLKRGAEYTINHINWFQRHRQNLDIELGERVKEKKRNTYYYLDYGMTIRFHSRSLRSLPKALTFYESPDVADRNFQIYLDWKSKQLE